jgi:hypothetical protein
MNLAKALKQKNRIAGEVARLKQLLGAQNVRPSTQKFDYDNKQVLADLRARIDELVSVKAGIAVANATIYARIFRLAEVKGLIDALQRLDTRSGVFKEAAMFGHAPMETEFIAQISKAEADKLVADLQTEAQQLQDELDEFNFIQAIA